MTLGNMRALGGSRGNKIDVRPNWKEQPPGDSLTGKSVAVMALWRIEIVRARLELLGTV
jgi:hypothetical protein